MQREQHLRGPISRLLWVAATILICGFLIVWGWNSGGAAFFGGQQIAYGQAVALGVAVAALAPIVAVATQGAGHDRWRRRHGATGDADDHG